MKKLFAVFLLAFPVTQLQAQTNISGGVYTNTTWTQVNSPYIVVDTVVVFPGVTLTIEPGVTVKFDDGLFLEMRNATIVANGTVTDSIIFTSNSVAPVPGIWGNGSNGGIWINGFSPASAFNFCRVEYATTGINSPASLKNSVFQFNSTGIYNLNVPTDSCIFRFNGTGVYNLQAAVNRSVFSNNTLAFQNVIGAALNYCNLDSNGTVADDMEHASIFYSSISYNQNGVRTHIISGTLIKYCTIFYNTNYGITFEPGDTITRCEIKYNGTGIILAGHVGYGGHQVTHCDIEFNSIGIHSSSNYSIWSTVSQCDISNNVVGIKISNPGVIISCNRICNNTTYGLQMNTPAPFNASNNFWCTQDSISTAAVIYDGYDNVTFGLVTFLPADTSLCFAPAGITDLESPAFTMFPNPAHGRFSVNCLNVGYADLQILNIRSVIVFRTSLSGKKEPEIDPQLPPGIYFVQVTGEKGSFTQKLVVQ